MYRLTHFTSKGSTVTTYRTEKDAVDAAKRMILNTRNSLMGLKQIVVFNPDDQTQIITISW